MIPSTARSSCGGGTSPRSACAGRRKTSHHPHFGELTLECRALHADEQGQRVVFYTAVPGSPTASVLCGLREAMVA
ncbi:hypothetical protein Drose_08230 [Dactylosporangium roseum]|uniref:MmyB-like transcription regulator ligand binding domain-containing protein n=1 Tax=Dactylosporangium roseum TaxID=47989 RepID=A0ABY5ZH28_9ACTN|nr:hypothetical protein Drose_08230 [Dactylosporangium roseum]